MFETKDTVYFSEAGAVNTEKALETAVQTAVKESVQAIVVATSTGETAFKLKDTADRLGYGGKLIAVRYHEGFHKPNEHMMNEENLTKLHSMGFDVHTGTHALSSITRSFRIKWQGIGVPEIVAETLRLFGRGLKTCVEVAVMAADGGRIPDIHEDVIAIAGTSKGADTALLLRAAYQNTFIQDMKIRRIICKPEVF
ncbi:pyruvate kinase alpha/beta domain-containing protein [Limisalsivibrio acetivorans]|uniref:pyruvate kinase alpha/beta domain-containing protein n=1 Tax=Limisalsivibrio acetivorans TaxID=1304888 RepID=UPI0003B60F07|nr:pyruvate kinase alpha/beta domain-containing protein [Limisalsivibrio acetivorans]